MVQPFRRGGRVALRRFPTDMEGSPALTAAALRHLVRPLDAARPAHADADWKRAHLSFCSHTQYSGRGGEFKETLGDRSRRRVTDLSVQLHSREYLSAFRFSERVRPKEVRTPDPNGHFELGGHSPRAGAFGRLAVCGMAGFYVCITLIKLGGSL